MSISIWVDGACRPHSPGGHATYGFLIKQDGVVIAEENGYIDKSPDMTNNVAEYTAIIEALSYSLTEFDDPTHIHIHSDSELVVNQLRDEYNIYSDRLRPLYMTAQTLLEQFPTDTQIQFQWIPREQNEHADELAKDAYRNHAYRHEEETARTTPMTVVAIGEQRYRIQGEFTVDLTDDTCTCEDFTEHGAKCTHLFKAILLENGEL